MVQRFTTSRLVARRARGRSSPAGATGLARGIHRAWLVAAMVGAIGGLDALGGLAALPLGGAFAGRRAAADRDAVDAARIDWAAGRITAGGTSVADRHAPSPAVARGTSRRGAEDAARRRIAAELPGLPLAGGGTLADRLADPAVKARVDAAVAAAHGVAAEPETDGSWHVTLAVPLEAVRSALDPPRVLAPSGDTGPAVVIVDAPVARPALGWRIAGHPAAMIWVTSVPAWAASAPRIAARPDDAAGAFEVAANPGTPASLYVVVTRGAHRGSGKPGTR